MESDKLIEEAMNAAIEWLHFVGQDNCRWNNLKGAEDAAKLMRRAVDVRDEASQASEEGK